MSLRYCGAMTLGVWCNVMAAKDAQGGRGCPEMEPVGACVCGGVPSKLGERFPALMLPRSASHEVDRQSAKQVFAHVLCSDLRATGYFEL